MLQHLKVAGLIAALGGLILLTPNIKSWAANSDDIKPIEERLAGQVLGAKITCGQSLTDSRDNQIYPTVKIGSACWFAKPLNAKASYGTTITANGLKYYSWLAVTNNNPELTNNRGLCPEGWHLPTEEEIITMAKAEGGACNKLNDGFGTYYCEPTSNHFVVSRATPDRFYYIQNYRVSDEVFWSGNIITSGATKYIKYGKISKTGGFKDYLLTDINRLSWNNPYNYMNALAFCVQDGDSKEGPGEDTDLNKYYLDSDNDGYGNQNIFTEAASQPSGYSVNGSDCNDSDNKIHPGATEICNQKDDDCDGQVDENCTTPPNPNPNFNCGQNLLDPRDNQNYKTETIGNYCWMTEPLNYNIQDMANQVVNGGNTFYSWPKASNGKITIQSGEQGLCPSGWHLPTETEVKDLGATISGRACVKIDDAWGTIHCPNAAGFLNKSSKVSRRRHYLMPQTEHTDLHFWMSDSVVISNGEDYLKFGIFSNAQNFYNDLMTEVTKKSWNRSAYMFNLIYCVRNNTINPTPGTFYRDADGDGYGNPRNSKQATSKPAGYVDNNQDCNDNNNKAKPGAAESCGTVDMNCDGKTTPCPTCYQDYDKDGYGDSRHTKNMVNNLCSKGYVSNSQDCNDKNNKIKPGATEICGNNTDDDCDGVKENGCKLCYRDADKDGFGNPKNSSAVTATSACKAGYIINNGDCNDSNNKIKPGATEICGNNIDDDCDGAKENGCKICYRDYDKDGLGNPKSSRAIAPTTSCPSGYVDNGNDCNDSDKKNTKGRGNCK